jgi:hypothetical protein
MDWNWSILQKTYLKFTRIYKHSSMQNPPQKTYTVKELFALKPEFPETEIIAVESSVAPVPVPQPDFSTQLPKKIGFWSKNKWYLIIGGVVCIAGTVWYLQMQSKKNKEKLEQN